MRNYFALILLVASLSIFSNITFAQDGNETNQPYFSSPVKFMDNVKSYTESSFTLVDKFGEVKKGDSLETLVYDGGQAFVRKIVDKYSNNEKIEYNFTTGHELEVKNVYYLSSGSLVYKHKYKSETNPQGEYIIDEKIYSSDGSLSSYRQWRCDKNKKVTSIKDFKTNGEPSGEEQVYEYDAKGNVASVTLQKEKSKGNNRVEYDYNDKGDVTSITLKTYYVPEKKTYSSAQFFNMEYEYDSHNNWTKKTISKTDYGVSRPAAVSERKIVYK